MAFSKQCCWFETIGCLLLLLLLLRAANLTPVHAQMMSRSDQKINDFVPVLNHFQGQLFFFISNKDNEQIYKGIIDLTNLLTLTLTSISWK